MAGAERGVDVLLVEDLGRQRLPVRSLAVALRRAGLTASLADLAGPEAADQVLRLAQDLRPRLVLFSVLFAGHVETYLDLATRLRQGGSRASLAMIGPLPVMCAAELLAACPALDAVLPEGEVLAALTLAQARDSNGVSGLDDVPGLITRAGSCRPAAASTAALPGDAWPWPARDGGLLRSPAGYAFATIEASRGCYHRCAFCLPCAVGRAAGTPYRLRGIPDLIEEIAILYDQGVRLLLFDDEQFLPPGPGRARRVADLAEGLASRALRLAFTIKCRPDDVERELFRRLQDAGLARVYLGVESGSRSALDLYQKGVMPDCNVAALNTLHSLGIPADFRMLMWHPWSTLADIHEELAFLAQVAPHVMTCLDFREVEVYPGTPLGERLRDEGRQGARPWPMAYTIPDPRVELLRRVSRLLFGAGSVYGRLQGAVSAAWYDLLVARRLAFDTAADQRAVRLAAQVFEINQQVLELWSEIVDFVEKTDIYDAAGVHGQTALWLQRLNMLAAGHTNEIPFLTKIGDRT
jgi:anaerobic magnesium-protoporphyrin IX monomethyl ester cyclase